jgi:hypothetical protein
MTKDSTLILRAVVSIGALVLIFLHRYTPKDVDPLTIGLVVLAFLPWLSPIIKSIEISGLGKIELKVDEVKEQVESLRFLVAGFVSKFEFVHLQNLAADGPFNYVKGPNRDDRFIAEIIRLTEFGLVRKLKEDIFLNDIPLSGDLKSYVVLTDQGKKYLELRRKMGANS